MSRKGAFPNYPEILYRDSMIKQVREWMKSRHLTNKAVVEMLDKEQFSISEGEFSKRIKLLSEEIPAPDDEKGKKDFRSKFKHQLTAAQYDLIKKLIGPKRPNSTKNQELYIDISGEVPLVVNTNETFFKGYLGTYFVRYYSTKAGEREIINGKLVLKPDEYDNSCNAVFTVDGDSKEYRGKWVILAKQSVCYCILHGKQSGELCMMVFDYLSLNRQDIKILLGVAATVSAGATRRRPTIHRICISRQKPTVKQMEMIEAHLKLNKRDILIREDLFKQWLEDHSDLQWLRPLIEHKENESLYYKFSEKEIKAKITREKKENISSKEIDEIICLLRGISETANNNKISVTANEALERLMASEEDCAQ